MYLESVINKGSFEYPWNIKFPANGNLGYAQFPRLQWDILELFVNLAKKCVVVYEDNVHSDDRSKKINIDIDDATLPKKLMV